MVKRITIEIEENKNGTEQIITNKIGITWTETIGYLERAKDTIITSDRVNKNDN